jgi:hypothetical protein
VQYELSWKSLDPGTGRKVRMTNHERIFGRAARCPRLESATRGEPAGALFFKMPHGDRMAMPFDYANFPLGVGAARRD